MADSATTSETVDQLLTLQEVCGILRMSMTTVHPWVKFGKIPAIRVGREWRVRQSDLDGWLETRRNTQDVA